MIYSSRTAGPKFVCASFPNLICYWELIYHRKNWCPLLYFMHVQRPTWIMRKATKLHIHTTIYCHKVNTFYVPRVENICALATRWSPNSGLQNMRNTKQISICTKTEVSSSQKKLYNMISVIINYLVGKLFSKACSINYHFIRREGGVLVTAYLRASCYFDIFFKTCFHILLIYFQLDATLHSLFISGKLLYMFRVVSPPIIRNTHNCIYSIWSLSNRYCYVYLSLSWKSWNWFEFCVGNVYVNVNTFPTQNSYQFQIFNNSDR